MIRKGEAMNGNDFLNAMTDVDDKHIIESEKKPVKRRGLFIGAMSAAAAVVIAVTAVSVNIRLGRRSNIDDPTSVIGNTNSSNSIIDNQLVAGGATDSNADPVNNTPGSVSVNREPQNDIVFPTAPTFPETSGELPKLTPRYDSSGSGMGGYAGSDEPETDIGNTWSAETNFQTLPVYNNISENPDREFMMETLKCVAETFGYDFSEMEIEEEFWLEESERSLRETYEGYGAPEEEIQRMIFISKQLIRGGTIRARIFSEVYLTINSRYEVEISWNNVKSPESDMLGFPLPDEYRLSRFTDEEMDKAGRYMLETYSNMFGIKNPVLNSNPTYENCVEYYEGGMDKEEFVNYHLNRVQFCFDKSGETIHIIRFSVPNGREKVGDYPIISIDEAKEQLYNNRYFKVLGTVDHDFNGTESIGAVELMYLDRLGHMYTMPYYHFEVGLTAEQSGFGDSGETRYFEYYVPAIADEYLGDWQSQPM